MKIIAATTFSLDGYNEYGYRMLETFAQFWDKVIDLYVYYDEVPPKGWTVTDPNIHYIPLNLPDLEKFKQRNINNPKQFGNGINPAFMFDGVKFSHKVYAYVDAALNKNADVVIWLDADTITHKMVNETAVLRWLNGKMAGSLFRPGLYTETGFHVFDMRYPEAKQFMKQWIDMYNLDTIWALKYYTDCHTFDETVKSFDINLWNNLSPTERHPHPFINGILGEYMDHTKGPRKKEGRSKKTDLLKPRTEDYWKNL